MSRHFPSKDQPLVIRIGEVEIDSSDMRFSVKVNGRPILGVRGVTIRGGVDDPWSCELEFVPSFAFNRSATEPKP